MPAHIPFEELGEGFADVATPADFPKHIIRYRNGRAAKSVGLPVDDDGFWTDHFGKFKPLENNLSEPLAIRYHGHQFQQYNPEIGDGRGFLFAQLRANDGRLLDLATKGSGQTKYSRFGDGRLTLKGGVREILATEMLEASGVYTSKTLSLIETGEQLARNDEPSPTRSSVMVRLGHSHIRFGAFQRLGYLGDAERIETLLRHVRQYYHDDIPDTEIGELAPALLKRISDRTASMVASWMAAGFVHGVMNTDNMNITGETFDFGPYRFLPHSDPKFTAAYFDQNGLYAFGRQPAAALWNLQQLGGVLTLVSEADDLSTSLQTYNEAYQAALRKHVFFQLGLKQSDLGTDLSFIQSFFSWMTESEAPWHQVFFDWFCAPAGPDRHKNSPAKAYYDKDDFTPIKQALLGREAEQPERLDHAYFQRSTPETLLINEIETLWDAIADHDDWSLFQAKLNGIAMKREAMCHLID